MSTEYDKALVDFLARKENLQYALDIEENIGAVKEKLFKSFWDQIKSAFDKKLNTQHFNSKYIIDRNFDNEWFGFYVFPKSTGSESKLVYQISQETHGGKWSIWYGITTKPHQPLNKFPHSEDLFKTIEKLENIYKYKETDKHCGRYLPYSSTKERFLIDIISIQPSEKEGSPAKEKAVELVDDAWHFFEEVNEHIVKINEAIEKSDKR